jgi:hypothetical protein
MNTVSSNSPVDAWRFKSFTMDVLDQLAALLAALPDRISAVGLVPAVQEVCPRIEELGLVVTTDEAEFDRLPILVSIINLLLDSSRGIVEQDTLQQILTHLTSGNRLADNDALREWRLGGHTLTSAARSGESSTLIDLRTFHSYYAKSFGLSSYSLSTRDLVWEELEAGLGVPIEALRLSSGSGIVWFTEHEGLLAQCCLGSDRRKVDAQVAYDRLGLDWSKRFEHLEDGSGRGRAVALVLPLAMRQEAEKGPCVPTAADGWADFLFAPNATPGDSAWPHASHTVHPATGEICLPQGIHGSLRVEPLTVPFCPAWAAGEIQREVADRLEEHGAVILTRALATLAAI